MVEENTEEACGNMDTLSVTSDCDSERLVMDLCPPPVQLVNHCLALDIDPEDQIEKQIMFEESKPNPTDYASVDDITLHRDEDYFDRKFFSTCLPS